MNIEKNLRSRFCDFMQSEYGCKAEKTDYEGEIARFLLKDIRLVLLREHFPRRSADTIEVFCSDKKLLEEIEVNFYAQIEQEFRMEQLPEIKDDSDQKEEG